MKEIYLNLHLSAFLNRFLFLSIFRARAQVWVFFHQKGYGLSYVLVCGSTNSRLNYIEAYYSLPGDEIKSGFCKLEVFQQK